MSGKLAVIMVGISGSGKSTLVRTEYPDGTVCSADHYMMEGAEYCFKASKLTEAHRRAQEAFYEACRWGCPLVVSDNPNLLHEHRRFYIDTALQFGYTVRLIVLGTTLEEAAGRNIHGVNFTTLQNMLKKLDMAPGVYEMRRCA